MANAKQCDRCGGSLNEWLKNKEPSNKGDRRSVLIYNAYEALVQARDSRKDDIPLEEAMDEAIGWLGQALADRGGSSDD